MPNRLDMCRHVRVTPYPVDLVAFVWLGLGVRFGRDEMGGLNPDLVSLRSTGTGGSDSTGLCPAAPAC